MTSATNMPGRVIFVDDDRDLRLSSVQMLALAELDVVAFGDGKSALDVLTAGFDGVVVSDIRMPAMDGLQLAEAIRRIDPDIPVILITGHADVDLAISALRNGALDFITKPFPSEELVNAVRRGLAARRLVLDNRDLQLTAATGGDGPLVGISTAMERLRSSVERIARTEMDVLIEGETGTGKEMVALLLHRRSARRQHPFVPINCGALTELDADGELFGFEHGGSIANRFPRRGRIETAHRGTLFLDEIDSMSPSIQAKLLRVLEDREIFPVGATSGKAINIRVIVSVKQGIEMAVASGKFRADLYYRLSAASISIPPLRERSEDAMPLFAHFCGLAADEGGGPVPAITASVRQHLLRHMWPGNVRELRHYAYRHVFQISTEGSDHTTASSLPEKVDQFEASLIRDALTIVNGNIIQATELLQVPRKTLYSKLSRYGISLGDYKSR